MHLYRYALVLFLVWERHMSCISYHTIVMGPSVVVMVMVIIIVIVMVSAIAGVVSELGDACFT